MTKSIFIGIHELPVPFALFLIFVAIIGMVATFGTPLMAVFAAPSLISSLSLKGRGKEVSRFLKDLLEG